MATYGNNFCEWWEIWREFELAMCDTNKKIAMICIFQANRYFRYNNNLMNR